MKNYRSLSHLLDYKLQPPQTVIIVKGSTLPAKTLFITESGQSFLPIPLVIWFCNYFCFFLFVTKVKKIKTI